MNGLSLNRMLDQLDQLVVLTGCRDREALDVAVTRSLMTLFEAVEVSLWVIIQDADQPRWLPLTVLRRGGALVTCDPMHADYRVLEPLPSKAERWQCVQEQRMVERALPEGTGTILTCLPLFSDSSQEDRGVVEVRSTAGLTPLQHEVVNRVIHVYRNMHGMFRYGERDALTGLLNRKSFEESFYKTLMEDASRVADQASGSVVELPLRREIPGDKFWLAMVDVDHFKQINDRHGHQIGDEVLILMARILKRAFRGYDRIYRFGGEEFVVLLRSPDHDAAVHTLERFRLSLEKYDFPQIGHITASAGLSEIQADDSPSTAFERADRAVYFAKRNGRNRVCSYADLVKQGLLQLDAKVGGVELF